MSGVDELKQLSALRFDFRMEVLSMTNTGNGFALSNNVVTGNSPTNYLVGWNGVVSDGVSQSFDITGSFIYDNPASFDGFGGL